MRTGLRVIAGAAALVVAIPLALYGAFLVVYQGDEGGGETYVELAGRDVDATLVGVVVLVAAAALAVVGAGLVRRGRTARAP